MRVLLWAFTDILFLFVSIHFFIFLNYFIEMYCVIAFDVRRMQHIILGFPWYSRVTFCKHSSLYYKLTFPSLRHYPFPTWNFCVSWNFCLTNVRKSLNLFIIRGRKKQQQQKKIQSVSKNRTRNPESAVLKLYHYGTEELLTIDGSIWRYI